MCSISIESYIQDRREQLVSNVIRTTTHTKYKNKIGISRQLCINVQLKDYFILLLSHFRCIQIDTFAFF